MGSGAIIKFLNLSFIPYPDSEVNTTTTDTVMITLQYNHHYVKVLIILLTTLYVILVLYPNRCFFGSAYVAGILIDIVITQKVLLYKHKKS
ncbi:hypothetical protein Lal_00020665 [Lupinus albus]|nr:hypothetical protein Lal_00020665 [Lupinus albus]